MAQAQQIVMVDRDHFQIGSTIGIYPFGGGFGLGEQKASYQGVHLDALRIGFSQLVADGIRMELSLQLGFSLLSDPGYVPTSEIRAFTDQPDASSTFGFHWGFGIGGYYRFEPGLTLGLGGELSFASGEFLDTSFFRVLPSIGWEIQGDFSAWYLHTRFVAGITMLGGLQELNDSPESSLSTMGIQVTYGL